MNRTATRLGVILLAGLAAAAVALALPSPPSPRSSPGAAGDTAQTAPPGVRVERRSGRDHVLTVASPALGREGRVRVLLPGGWRPGSGPWPVLYLLNGCCQPAYDSWAIEGEAARLTARHPVIVVMPESGSVGFYSDWRDGPGWETFHLTEVRGILERDYGAGDRRAVAGLSMGGFGAISYAARHPGMFRAAASFSGVLDTTESAPWLLERHGEDPADLWGPPGGPLWRAHNPVALTARLKGVRLFVSCGDGNPGPLDDPSASRDGGEATLLAQAEAFAERARADGADITTDFYGPGTHSWPYWQRSLERALPMLMDAIDAG
ncbi:esterase family protein [Planomonospora sp. ID67723]|uniref:alpha/beta hydrolase n=1 Tax=Planomonospora sp. ID67723 TaxID=2738134 RepID=UPI0018C43CFD|nr:alpha/beta hydrolase family protein [Planomonospora sp. ID67723]MBG0829920.1 esterase family protein [Planomonospora sp. ID67723]